MRQQLNLQEYIEYPLTHEEVQHYKKCDQQCFWYAALISVFTVIAATFLTYGLGNALSPEHGLFNQIKAAIVGLFVAGGMFFIGHTFIWQLLSKQSQWPRFQITEMSFEGMPWLYGGDYVEQQKLPEGSRGSQLDSVQSLITNIEQQRGYAIRLDADIIRHLHGRAIFQYSRELQGERVNS